MLLWIFDVNKKADTPPAVEKISDELAATELSP